MVNVQDRRSLIDLSRPIIVSMENFSSLVDSKCVSDDGLTWKLTLMTFDDESRNRNVYPMDDTKRSFKESAYVQENLRNRTWFGELEHPDAEAPLSRFLRVEPTRVAWCILGMEDMGDRYTGTVALADPLGTEIVLKNIQRFGSNYASSCRIYTPNFIETNKNGAKIFIKKYKMYPVTFECVTMPGLPKCRILKDGEYIPGPISSTENAGVLATGGTTVVKFDNPANEIKAMLKSQEASKILEDYFHADFKKNAILTSDGRVSLSTEDGVSVSVPLNSHLLSSVLK